jgi:peptidoglycan-N-acetylglucosamine deacetylase
MIMELANPEWPNGARCAVALTFDNFGESFDLLRYGYSGGANADGVYAPRRGIPRILDLLERYEIPATFFLEGWNVKKYASLAKEIAERGHEIGGHGWMHETWDKLGLIQERELVRRTTDAIGEVLGEPPVGWRAPGGLITPETLSLLHGAGYQYDSSFGDDDVPYRIQVARDSERELTELPWQWSLDDAPYYAHPGTIRHPDEVIDIWSAEFDAAYEMTGFFMLVCHPRYSGRPARVRALERLIEHIKTRDDVWFARCRDIAEAAAGYDATPRYDAPEKA